MPYKIPSNEEVLRAIKNVMNNYGVINSQTKLKELVERDLKVTDKNYLVSPKRLRVLALSSDNVRIEIHCRDSDEKMNSNKCPVCNHNLKLVRNKTIYNGVVIIGHECDHCPYWTGMKKRIPTRYVFTVK